MLQQGQLQLDEPFDLIFCRNVIIYFDQQTQQNVINFLTSALRPHGALYLGHSETLGRMAAPLRLVGKTAYVKT
ncbi:CheR family methyltransferase [Magnetofaba australis]|uniref:CheR family methyltransferase n=1 Tax=Magnetofaba australis TaxID=1472297 RepID=UPI0018E9CAC8|nr:CheR family methyltransferase [Magnetofaba australis]